MIPLLGHSVCCTPTTPLAWRHVLFGICNYSLILLVCFHQKIPSQGSPSGHCRHRVWVSLCRASWGPAASPTQPLTRTVAATRAARLLARVGCRTAPGEHAHTQTCPAWGWRRGGDTHLACGRHREVEAVRGDAHSDTHARETQVALAQDGGQRFVGGLGTGQRAVPGPQAWEPGHWGRRGCRGAPAGQGPRVAVAVPTAPTTPTGTTRGPQAPHPPSSSRSPGRRALPHGAG